MIPRQFHFVSFTASSNRGGKPFAYANYLCLWSVIKAHPGAEFFFYYNEPIVGEWFDRLKPFLTLEQVEAPPEIFGIPILRVEHQADITRLKTLIDKGGVYLDTDIFLTKPLDELLTNRYVMGIENGMGLCNGVIMSEAHSPFMEEWLNAYHPDCKREGAGFDPEGWGEMSVRFPEILSKEFEDYMTILPVNAFFQPSGCNPGLEILFDSLEYDCEESYGNHLWASRAWDNYLSTMTPKDVLEKPGYFYKMVRRTLTTAEINGELFIQNTHIIS